MCNSKLVVSFAALASEYIAEDIVSSRSVMRTVPNKKFELPLEKSAAAVIVETAASYSISAKSIRYELIGIVLLRMTND